MASVVCRGVVGDTALGFLAGLGVANVCASLTEASVSIAWETGSWALAVDSPATSEELADLVALDAEAWSASRVLEFSYPKREKSGVKTFKGLRAPVAVWRAWLERLIDDEDHHALEFAAALADEAAVEEIPDAKCLSATDLAPFGVAPGAVGSHRHSTLPTFFDFTSRNAQFLDQADVIRRVVTAEVAQRAILAEPGARITERTMGWGSSNDRPAALYSYGGDVDPVLEWLAFRGLSFLPVTSDGNRLRVTACSGRRKSGVFTWPLWDARCSVPVVRALLKADWVAKTVAHRRLSGVTQVFQSDLSKAADGYSGVFLPSRPA